MQTTLLSRILQSTPSDRPVARNADGIELTLHGFLAGAALWRRAAIESGLPTAVLFAEDAAELLPAVFGCWAANVHVVLPGDALAGALDRLQRAGLTPANAALGLDAVAMDEAHRWPAIRPAVPFAEFNARPAPAEGELPALDDKSELLSLLTSGSTGEAKLVRKRLEQIFFEPESIHSGLVERLGCEPEAWGDFEVLGTVSAQHIYGHLFRLLWPLMEPTGIVVGPRLHYPEALEAALRDCAARGRCAAIIASPSHLKRFTDPALFAPSMGTAVAVFSSAGPLEDAGALNARRAFGLFPFEVLGSTETGGIAWRQRRLRAGAKLSDESPALETPVWRPVEGIEASVNIDGTHAIEGTGLIAVAGRHLEHEGWIDGADRIFLSHGGFELLGRADRIAKIEGKRVSLPEVEQLLLATGWVSAARVFVRRSQTLYGREALHAACVPTPAGRALFFEEGKGALTAKIKAELAKSLPAVALPRRWRYIDELPVNAQGKTPLSMLCDLFDPKRPEWLIETDRTDRGTRTLTLRLTAASSLKWFEGHFPKLPILPGVAQLLLVERAVREFTDVAPDVTPGAVKTLKFRALTKPDMALRLRLTMPDPVPTGTWKLTFEWLHLEPAPGVPDGVQSSGMMQWRRRVRLRGHADHL